MVKTIDLHFYHGFLGTSQDWDPVIENLTGKYNIWTNDLTKTFLQSYKGLSPEESYLERWAHCESLLWGDKHTTRILVGYSLGGRLVMHIDPNQYDAMILLSSHPGLQTGREERSRLDEQSSERMSVLKWSEWLTEWNSQDTFMNDQNRPDRTNQAEFKQCWAKILKACSLGGQSLKDAFLHENKDKVIWAYGSKDPNYSKLKERMVEVLGHDRVVSLEGVGHGLPFERPKQIAEIVEKVIDSV